jgi:hypothetical protein
MLFIYLTRMAITKKDIKHILQEDVKYGLPEGLKKCLKQNLSLCLICLRSYRQLTEIIEIYINCVDAFTEVESRKLSRRSS